MSYSPSLKCSELCGSLSFPYSLLSHLHLLSLPSSIRFTYFPDIRIILISSPFLIPIHQRRPSLQQRIGIDGRGRFSYIRIFYNIVKLNRYSSLHFPSSSHFSNFNSSSSLPLLRFPHQRFLHTLPFSFSSFYPPSLHHLVPSIPPLETRLLFQFRTSDNYSKNALPQQKLDIFH